MTADTPEPALGPVLVIGCGLIGTSVALALRSTGIQVHLRDPNEANLALAVSLGAGVAEPVAEPELVVVAAPPAAVAGICQDALAEFPGAVVTDVASVKAAIVETVVDERFVGGHPMAGKERSGPMAATAQLFEGRAWAIVPSATSAQASVELVTALAKTVKAVPRLMAPAAHDRAVALVSHVPQLVSVLTAGLLTDAQSDDLALAGQGLRDVIRIAGSDRGLWEDIIASNAEQVGQVLDTLHDRLGSLRDSVKAVDGSIGEYLDLGRAGVARVPGKHGERPTELAVVFVSIDDTPGELSRLLSDIGTAGINIEDMRIDHELGRQVGVVEVVVNADVDAALLDYLSDRGWAAFR